MDKILDNSAEQFSNQIVQMLQNDKFLSSMSVYDTLKSRVSNTDHFTIYMDSAKETTLQIKNKALLSNLKHTTEEYEYPKLMCSETDKTDIDYSEDLNKVYKQWVMEEFGDEFYRDELLTETTDSKAVYNPFAQLPASSNSTCPSKERIFNRKCHLDGYFNIKDLKTVPVHIRTALYAGKIFKNEHPKKPIYMYDSVLNQFTRCKIV
jgi:hypothetical protein